MGISLRPSRPKGILPSRCRAQEMLPCAGVPCECAGVCMPADVCTICVMVYALRCLRDPVCGHVSVPVRVPGVVSPACLCTCVCGTVV